MPSGKYSSDCTVHVERTLDEAYFPGLSPEELALRNVDQIVSSSFRGTPDGTGDCMPILVVPQLWLWRFGDILVTAHSTSLHIPRAARLPELLSKLSEPCGFWPHFRQRDIEVQIGLVMADFIRRFGKEIGSESGCKIPPTLDLFESRVVSVLSEVKRYINETKRNAIEYSSEANFLHVLSDCRSELAMIQHVLEQQEEIITSLLDDRTRSSPTESNVVSMNSPTPSKDRHDEGKSDLDSSEPASPATPLNSPHDYEIPVKTPPAPDWSEVEEALAMLKQYQRRIKKIDSDAERIEKNVQDLLNLKRTYASVQDSHAGVLLSVAAIGFAIVTVIFAPLAFLVGLFALNLQGFDRLRIRQGNGQQRPGGNNVNGAGSGDDLSANIGSNNGPVFDSGKMAGIFSKSIYFHFTALQVRMTLILSSRHRDYHHSRNVFARMDIATMVRHRLHRLSHGARGKAGEETRERNKERRSKS
jgi:hypothetical protein